MIKLTITPELRAVLAHCKTVELDIPSPEAHEKLIQKLEAANNQLESTDDLIETLKYCIEDLHSRRGTGFSGGYAFTVEEQIERANNALIKWEADKCPL